MAPRTLGRVPIPPGVVAATVAAVATVAAAAAVAVAAVATVVALAATPVSVSQVVAFAEYFPRRPEFELRVSPLGLPLLPSPAEAQPGSSRGQYVWTRPKTHSCG